MPKNVAQCRKLSHSAENCGTVPKIVAQCQKRPIPYLYTMTRTIDYAYKLPNAIAYLNTCIPYLNTCITFLNTLTRLSAPYPNTLNRHDNQSESNKPRQPIRIEYYVTLVVSQSESSTREPSALGSQSESSITSPDSSLRHLRALALGGGPFSALDSSRLNPAFVTT